MNKLIKTCVIGGIAWASLEMVFHQGKGYMLGLMCAYEGMKTPSDVLDAVSSDKRIKMKIISKTAKLKLEEMMGSN